MENINVKDAAGESRTIKTTETDGIHTPHHIAEGPLTDAELRSSPVAVIGPLTDDELRANPISTNGLTDAQLRASPVPVSGGLTDTQLRADPVEVQISNTSQMPVEDAPLSSGYFDVSDTVVNIAIPTGAVMARLYPVDGIIKFRIGDSAPADDPVLGATDALALGGYALATEWRTFRILAAVGGYLKLLSAETGSGDPTVSVLVEFTGQGAV